MSHPQTDTGSPAGGVVMTNILSLAAGLGVISFIFMIAGVNPLFAISEIFQGSFGSVYGFKETVTKAIP